MSVLNVNAVRHNESGHITHLLCYELGSPHPMDYYPTEASATDVIKAIKNGYKVSLELGNTTFSEAEFHVVITPDGSERISISGFSLADLPSF